MHVCAWCDCKLGILPGTVRGIPATNWGMCPACLSKRLKALVEAPPETPYELDLTRLEATRRLDELV
jgi:hypothetical protein